jgi:hypothetical protein
MRVPIVIALAVILRISAAAEPAHSIVIDGFFADWHDVPTYTDPVDDTHDTDHSGIGDSPEYVEHPDVDLIEYKLAHDNQNLYAYFRATGVIGRTQNQAQGPSGRYYIIATIDVDDDQTTGYWLHEGGYYPTSCGYDMNMEVEFHDGAFNTGHYINHGCLNEIDLAAAFNDQSQGIVRVFPGSYDWYTQWVMFDTPPELPEQVILPDGTAIVWVQDRGPVYQGIVRVALSPDGHEAEMAAPFRGFMKDPDGNPILAPPKTINASFSLEASGELAPGLSWASDTAEPIVGYQIEQVQVPAASIWGLAVIAVLVAAIGARRVRNSPQ